MALAYTPRDGAREEQLQQLTHVADPARLAERFAGLARDAAAWREQLIAYFLGELAHKELLAPLQDQQAFNKSDLHYLGVYGLNYQGLRSEAYFYDALLQQVSGDPSTRQSRHESGLKKTLEISNAALYEYLMASYLLQIQKLLE